jgi:hypothetical protein
MSLHAPQFAKLNTGKRLRIAEPFRVARPAVACLGALLLMSSAVLGQSVSVAPRAFAASQPVELDPAADGDWIIHHQLHGHVRGGRQSIRAQPVRDLVRPDRLGAMKAYARLVTSRSWRTAIELVLASQAVWPAPATRALGQCQRSELTGIQATRGTLDPRLRGGDE